VIIAGCEKFPPSDYEVGHLKLGSAYEICVDDEYAYVSTNKGLAIIDKSNPSKPDLMSIVNTNGTSLGALYENNIIYAGGEACVKIINVESRSKPVTLSSINTPGNICGIQKQGNTLFMAANNGRLVIVDIQDVQTPQIVSVIDCKGSGTDIAVVNNYVYFANAQTGLQIIDVSDIQAPELLSEVPGTYGAWDIHVDNGYLFLGKHRLGFSIFRIEADDSLSEIFSGTNGGEAYGIFRYEESLYIADLVDGVEIWDIIDMEEPVIIETMDEYSPHDLVVSDGKIYVADQDRHFVIIDY